LTRLGESRHSIVSARQQIEEAQPMSAEKPTVLFLCADNSVRSQLAEALLRHRCGDRYDCCSAGLAPKPVHPMVETALREIGIEPDALAPKPIRPFLGHRGVRHAIILRTPDETEAPRIFPFATQTVRWDVSDPTGDSESPEDELVAMRRTRDDIDGRLKSWLEKNLQARDVRTSAA
jgi:arsenate reductase (thioredoxin)